MISIDEFCNKHKACSYGRQWAIDNCDDMLDAWRKLKPDWLIWVAARPGVLTDRELRLFTVFCARQVEHLLKDERLKDAISIAERFANGEATAEEMDADWDAAWCAATTATAARDADAYAAWAAARTTWAAAATAARATDADAASDAQADWLRANTSPNFQEMQ